MLGEAFVEVGVVGAEEVEGGAVFANEAIDEEAGFGLEGGGEGGVEIGEELFVGFDGLEGAEAEPLGGEVVHEGGGARVGEHAADFAFEGLGVVQIGGGVEEGFVGDGAPEEERQAGGEFEAGEGLGGAIEFEAEEEVRGEEDVAESGGDGLGEGLFFAGCFEGFEEGGQVGRGDVAPEGAADYW